MLPCFDVIQSIAQPKNFQTLITQMRMIIDNYSILYLLTSFSSSKEQQIRHYLFLLDAVISRSKIIDSFSPIVSNGFATGGTKQQSEIAKEFDKIAESDIIKLLKDEKLYSTINENIIKNRNWKFKNINDGKDNKFNWIEIYKLSRIPNRYSEMIQKYYSSFVHGLGISLMLNESEELSPLIISILDLSSIIQSMIIKILLNEFKNETKQIKLQDGTLKFIDDSWNNWK